MKPNIQFRPLAGTLFVLTTICISNLQSALRIVKNTNDSGGGTLRQAILDAQTALGPDTIVFRIPSTSPGYDASIGTWTIRLLSTFPTLASDSTVIDGSTQSIYIGGDPNPDGPEIVISGESVDINYGFLIQGSGNVIRGLVIHRFVLAQILVLGNRNGIFGSFVGPDAAGRNRVVSTGSYIYGIQIRDGSYNTIGGESFLDQNVVSGNRGTGIEVSSSACWNTIAGNYIGITSDGADTLGNTSGIFITQGANHNTIGPGNTISGNKVTGLYVSGDGADSNIVKGNRIGTDPSGSLAMRNIDGVKLEGGPRFNTVGGILPEDANVISGNVRSGLIFTGSATDSNLVIGNRIGTNSAGDQALANGDCGILIWMGASRQMIGGQNPGEGNIISGNAGDGIHIRDNGTDHNQITGNRIGTDAGGTVPLGNGYEGISIRMEAQGNVVGPGNTIAYNGVFGVMVDFDAIENTITQNSIHDNVQDGIRLSDGGNGELPAPVLASLGPLSGTAPPLSTVEIFSDSSDEGRIFHGLVLADAGGHFSWSGVPSGPYVTATATDTSGNTSGFSSPKRVGGIIVVCTEDSVEGSLRWAIEEANLSSGPDTILFDIPETDPGFDGTVWTISPLSILPAFEDDSTVLDGESQKTGQGDTNPAGPEIFLDGRVGYVQNGLMIQSSGNTVIGLTVSGFSSSGILLQGGSVRGNRILGCFLGTDAAGLSAVPNYFGISLMSEADGNLIGGAAAGEGNCVSGNTYSGIMIVASDSNVVLGNRIGTDFVGTNSLRNDGNGISIEQGSKGNRIGGSDPGQGNIISGNSWRGVKITGKGTNGNTVLGNCIGLASDGFKALPNGTYGIEIDGEASSNRIGGIQLGEGNVISGNSIGISIMWAGADSNTVSGNRIGTDMAGTAAVPNTFIGIEIYGGPQGNRIGPANLVSGNVGYGIDMGGYGTSSNAICGNWIGLDVTGQDTIPNGIVGIALSLGPTDNTVGGEEAADGNVISGNREFAIAITDSADNNRIENNLCGTDTSGTLSLGNGNGLRIGGCGNHVVGNVFSGNRWCGVEIGGVAAGNVLSNNHIGVAADGKAPLPNGNTGIKITYEATDNTIGPENVIRFNRGFGIELLDPTVQRITITGNSIASNDSGGIALKNGANQDMEAPVITAKMPVSGTAPPGSWVEVFSDSSDQGRVYEGRVTADAAGNWTWSGSPAGPFVTATATDADGNTSVFSESFTVSVARNDEPSRPGSFFLSQNHPNPFNDRTRILFGVEEKADVVLDVLDVMGRKVVELAKGRYAPGVYEVEFDADGLPPGIYFYRIRMGSFLAVRKSVLIL